MAPQSTEELLILSGSTNGMPIKVVQTATLGTTIHTVGSGTTNIEKIWLWAVNTSAATVLLTIEFGDATVPDHNIPVNLAPKTGLVLVVEGLPLNNAKAITAFAGSANVINIDGYAIKMTP